MKATLRELYEIGPLPLLAVIALYTVLVGATADLTTSDDFRSIPIFALLVAGLAWLASLIGGSRNRAERRSYVFYLLVFLAVGALETRWSVCHVNHCL